MQLPKVCLLGLLLALAPIVAIATEWPQFRGADGSGVANQQSLPVEWSQDKNIEWKVKVPGVAWSSPIVWGERLYVTTAATENQPKPTSGGGGFGRFGRRPPRGDGEGPGAERPERPRPPRDAGEGGPPRADNGDGPNDPGPPRRDRPERRREGNRPGGGRGGFGRSAEPPASVYKWEVLCLDRKTGEVLWNQTAAEHRPTIPTHRTNTYASETPVTDGERIYAYFGMTGIFCYDMDGNLLWKQELGSFPMMNGWGTGSSPILADDLVIIQCDNEKESFIVAFDKKTGQQKWRDDRDERSTWSTPYLWKNKSRTELVTGGSSRIRSYEPATGKILWEMTGLSGRAASTPVGDDELVYFGTGGGMGVGPLVAIRAGAAGEFSLDSRQSADGPIAWVADRGGPPMASPLLYEGHLYILDQRGGILTCYDARTGKVAYKERLAGATGFTASPWAADGKVYCTDGDGTTFVLTAGPKFELISKNPLGEMVWSSPALADGDLFLRTVDYLYCIRSPRND